VNGSNPDLNAAPAGSTAAINTADIIFTISSAATATPLPSCNSTDGTLLEMP